MRFAWLQENSANATPSKPAFTNQLILAAYNVVWWIPIVLAFAKIIDYRTGFIAFAAVTAVRAAANLYRNNMLTLEQGQKFPLRAP
jgi:hypothetical protein